MKKEWVHKEKNRCAKKRKINLMILEKVEDVDKVLSEMGDGDIVLPKHVLADLVQKSHVTR